MPQILVGTSFNQIYKIPLDNKTPITIIGQKKKVPVTSICIYNHNHNHHNHDHNQSHNHNCASQIQKFIYSNQKETYVQNINKQGNQQQEEQQERLVMPAIYLQQNQKIIHYQYLYQQSKGLYCTNHGNVYTKNFPFGISQHQSDQNQNQNQKQNSKQHKYTKRFHNDTYIDRIKSLPPQRAGTPRLEYKRVALQINQSGIIIGFVGRGVLPFVYQGIFAQDTGTVIFKAKNVPNDELDLQVPINDVDACFINQAAHLVVAHADNKIRVYDIRSKRRKPILDVTLIQVIKFEKSKLNKIVKNQGEKYLYVANQRGSIYQLDVQKKYAVIGKIKGVTTTITDMKYRDGQLYVISLDGYLRIFSTVTKQKQFQRYLNTHPLILKLQHSLPNIQQNQQQAFNITQINLDQNQDQNDNKKDKTIQKVKKIRKRNKVGLKYIQNAHFDDVKLQDMEKMEMKQEVKDQINDSDLDL